MKKLVVLALAAVVAALSLAAGAATAPGQTTSLTIYSGREQALVKPIMDRFTKETGIELNVRYASSTALATALVEEGRNSPADVYWSQEPGTLGLVGARGLLARLPQSDGREGAVAVRDTEPALGRHERPLSRARLQHERAPGERAPGVGLGPDELARGRARSASPRRTRRSRRSSAPRSSSTARHACARGSRASRRTTCASTRTTRPSSRPSAAATSRSVS